GSSRTGEQGHCAVIIRQIVKPGKRFAFDYCAEVEGVCRSSAIKINPRGPESPINPSHLERPLEVVARTAPNSKAQIPNKSQEPKPKGERWSCFIGGIFHISSIRRGLLKEDRTGERLHTSRRGARSE